VFLILSVAMNVLVLTWCVCVLFYFFFHYFHFFSQWNHWLCYKFYFQSWFIVALDGRMVLSDVWKKNFQKLSKNRTKYRNRVFNKIIFYFYYYSFNNLPKFLKFLHIMKLSMIHVLYNFQCFLTIFGWIQNYKIFENLTFIGFCVINSVY